MPSPAPKPDPKKKVPHAGPTPHGQPLAEERLDDRLRCPKDAFIMEKITVGSVTVDRCANCGSMWFDALELDKVLHTTGGARALDFQDEVKRRGGNNDAPRGRPIGAMVCPRDRSPLIKMVDQKQTHIQQDACTVCGGVLLDAGELNDLSEVTLKERIKGLFGK